MQKISFEITTPNGVAYKDFVDEISLPTTMGEITVLPNHIPLVSILKPGELKVKKDGNMEFLATAGGFIEVQPGNRVVVLADNAERAEEIDIERAEKARQRAEALMKEKQVDNVEYAALASKLEREIARIKVAKRHRSRMAGISEILSS